MFLINYFRISLIFFVVLINAAQIWATHIPSKIFPSKILHQKTKIRQLKVSTNPNEVNILCESGTFRSLNLADETLLAKIKSQNKTRAYSFDISNDATRILIRSGKALKTTIKLFDAHGNELANLNKEGLHIGAAEFTPDGSKIFALFRRSDSDNDTIAVLFDSNGNELHMLTGEWNDISFDSFCPDGSCIIFESGWGNDARNKAYLWDFGQNILRTFLAEPKSIREKLFIDNNRVIIVLFDRSAFLWDFKNNTKRELKSSSWRSYLSLSPQKDLMASFSFGKKKIMMLDLEGNELARLDKNNTRSDLLHFTLDGSKMITLFTNEILQVWDIKTNKKNFLFGHEKPIKDACVSPDDQYIVTTSKDHSIRLWNLQGKQLHFLDKDAKAVSELSFSADGKRIIGYEGKNLLIWDVSSLTDTNEQI